MTASIGARVISIGLALNPGFECINLEDGRVVWPKRIRSWEKKIEPQDRKTKLAIEVAAGDYVNDLKVESILKLSVNEENDVALLENGDRCFANEIYELRKED